MKYLKRAYLIFAAFFASCLPSDSFQKIDTEFDKTAVFKKSNTPIDAFLEQGFEIHENGNIVNITKKDHTQAFKNIVFISYVDSLYIGLITGLPTLDAGWKYLISPTYSDLVFLDKNDLSVVFKKRVNHSVSDLVLTDSLVFFEYGNYPKLKYGQFEFE